MAIRFTAGSGSLGDAGPVPDQRVKKNARPTHVGPTVSTRRAASSDDARIARLEARLEAVENAVAALAGRVRDALARPVDASTQASTISSHVDANVSTPSTDNANVSTGSPTDRKAYQRQWARKRRAAKKAKLAARRRDALR
jgi:hypothetical protein